MAEATTVSGPVTGTEKTLSFEAGKLAGQADGAVVIEMGGTVVLVTATAAKSAREGADFFPLTVDVEERMYAAGRIPGSFFRREGKASDQAILTCRLTDRPLRPAFPDGFRNEVHVVGTVLGADLVNPHDVLMINGASAALSLSGIPFDGPIGAVRLAYSADGEWIPYPTYEEGEASTFEMVVAGRQLDDGDVAITMVEAGGTEATWPAIQAGAPKVDEATITAGLEASKAFISESIRLQRELMDEVGVKPPVQVELFVDYSPEIFAAVEQAAGDRVAQAMTISDKAERAAAEDAIKSELVEQLGAKFDGEPDADKQIKAAFRSLTKQTVRKRIVDEGVRIDGRGPKDIRPLSAEVAVLPTVHGSGLFQRGETQVLNVTTLGMPRMEQQLDTLSTIDRKRYMHHYNFPPYSTGETGFIRGPKRREIGHGILAERALVPVLPSKEEFAYTIRTVSDVLSSNGSTSMGSVCSSSLSLMDAGVPLKAPVAGIAMGLVFAEGKYTTLTDILGAEDAFGDMDFKVAGTAEFITALQLDTKIDGIPSDVLGQALQQAREARLAILEVMHGAIAEPRDEVGATAPKIISFEIPMDKIGEVIGPKGKVINGITAETGADVSVDDDGTVGRVSIGSTDSGAVAEAERQIKLILDPPSAEVGQTYPGKVVNITKFGAFVNILPGRDGLLHISKLGGGKRIDRVEDVLQLGDEVEVKVDDIDPGGKVSLSLVGAEGSSSGGGESRRSESSADRDRDDDGDSDSDSSGNGREYVSFEDAFDEEVKGEFGDLGPETAGSGAEVVTAAAAAIGVGAAVDAEVAVLVGAVDVTPRAPAEADPGIEKTVLPSGIRVVTERMPEAKSVATGIWVGVGSRDEPDELAGASHFLEHLLFKGTEVRSARSIATAIDAAGGEMNAFTSRESTAFYTRLPVDRLAFAIELLTDVVGEPAFRRAEVEAEREVIVEEILMSEDAPDDVAMTALYESLFPEHGVGRQTLGSRASIEQMPRDAIVAFHGEQYRPANLVVVAAGDLEHDEVVASVDSFLVGVEPGARPTREAPTVAPVPRRVIERPTEQAHVAMGWRGLHFDDPDRYALWVANHIAGGGMSSRLFQEVREERGLAYTVYTSPSSYQDCGSLSLYAGTSPTRLNELLDVVSGVIDGLLTAGVTEDEYDVAVGFLTGSLLLGLEDTASRMARLGSSETTRDEVISIEEHLARIRAVTLDDVHRVLQRVFGPPHASVVVGPFGDAAVPEF